MNATLQMRRCHKGHVRPEFRPTSLDTLESMSDAHSKAGSPSGASEKPAAMPRDVLLTDGGPDRLLFVLRLWSEPDGAGTERSPLRGSVERVDTHELRYFDHLSSLEDLVKGMVGGDTTGTN